MKCLVEVQSVAHYSYPSHVALDGCNPAHSYLNTLKLRTPGRSWPCLTTFTINLITSINNVKENSSRLYLRHIMTQDYYKLGYYDPDNFDYNNCNLSYISRPWLPTIQWDEPMLDWSEEVDSEFPLSYVESDLSLERVKEMSTCTESNNPEVDI